MRLLAANLVRKNNLFPSLNKEGLSHSTKNLQIKIKIQPNLVKITLMRVDKFLNIVNITKRRAISEDMCKSGVVSINGVVAKPSKEVKIGDKITIKFIVKEVSYEVLAIPTTKSIPKSEQSSYVKEI